MSRNGEIYNEYKNTHLDICFHIYKVLFAPLGNYGKGCWVVITAATDLKLW